MASDGGGGGYTARSDDLRVLPDALSSRTFRPRLPAAASVVRLVTLGGSRPSSFGSAVALEYVIDAAPPLPVVTTAAGVVTTAAGVGPVTDMIEGDAGTADAAVVPRGAGVFTAFRRGLVRGRYVAFAGRFGDRRMCSSTWAAYHVSFPACD